MTYKVSAIACSIFEIRQPSEEIESSVKVTSPDNGSAKHSLKVIDNNFLLIAYSLPSTNNKSAERKHKPYEMTKTQEAKLNMYNAVIAYCDASTTITADLPAFAPALAVFKAKRTAITTTAQSELQVISGITTTKEDLKKLLCNITATVAAAVYAYASSINDAELKAKMKCTENSLFKKKDDEIGPIVQNIQDDANAHLAALAPYGITTEVLTALQAAKNNYTAKANAPRNALAQRKTYKEQLVILFKDTDTFLKTQLDKLALQLKAATPGFYNTYTNNRIIINAATSHTKAVGVITNSVTAEELFAVVVTVLNETYTATSDIMGAYNLLIPEPGIYTILFSKAGYTTYEAVNTEIKLGETTHLDVQLVPLPQ